MDALTFLKGLPAILGIVGFFAYLWAGQQRIGGDLLKDIIQKLRSAPNVNIQNYDALTPSRISALIESDTTVKSAVNEQDARTLRLIIILQYAVTSLVLLVCAVLIGLGVWLINRPESLSVIPHPPARASSDGDSSAPLLDLDALKVEWDSRGVIETVSVFLENVETSARTPKKTMLADVRSATFSPDEVIQIASRRDYHDRNAVRTVIEWSSNTARSSPVDVMVGIKIQLKMGATEITPESTQSINYLIATIDNSTEHMPPRYCFAVDFAGWSSSKSALVAPIKSCNDNFKIALPFLDKVDWDRHVGLVFNQPLQDRPLARYCIEGPQVPTQRC